MQLTTIVAMALATSTASAAVAYPQFVNGTTPPPPYMRNGTGTAQPSASGTGVLPGQTFVPNSAGDKLSGSLFGLVVAGGVAMVSRVVG
jgi:hypothetical protein